MNKKEVIKTLDISSFVSAVIATLLVLIFEFTGEYMVMKVSIVMYAACFLILITMLSIRVYNTFKKKEVVEGEEVSETSITKQKVTAILLLAGVCVAFIFTCTLLILY